VLPNLDIVASGNLPAADRLVLTAHAKQTADRVWTASAASLLTAIDAGRDLTEFTTFLTQRTEHELPGALRSLIADVCRKAGQLADLGPARVIECADAAAALMAHDRQLRPLCRPIGDRHLAVPPDQELKFGKALLELGHALPGRPTT
jgi:Helicase conserved C-terminal domain